jgi:hypothetical protein
MKLRSLATLLALTSLPACRGGDFLPPDHDLVGEWGTNPEAVRLVFPDGEREVQGQVFLSLSQDGGFTMQMFADDTQRGRVVAELIARGTYTARDGVSEITVTGQYQRAGGEPVANPVVAPVSPYTMRDHYTVMGSSMTFVPVCPPGALCVQPRFTRYHSLHVDLLVR